MIPYVKPTDSQYFLSLSQLVDLTKNLNDKRSAGPDEILNLVMKNLPRAYPKFIFLLSSSSITILINPIPQGSISGPTLYNFFTDNVLIPDAGANLIQLVDTLMFVSTSTPTGRLERLRTTWQISAGTAWVEELRLKKEKRKSAISGENPDT